MTKPLSDVVYGQSRRTTLAALWRLSNMGTYSAGVIKLAANAGQSLTSTQTALGKLRDEGAISADHIGFNNVVYKLLVRPEVYEPEPPKPRGTYRWTDEKIKMLDRLWDDRSIGVIEIGVRLGFGGDAKNAVIGMAHRRGLPSRGNPVGVSGKQDAPRASPRLNVRALPKLASEQPTEARAVPLAARIKAIIQKPPTAPIAHAALIANGTKGHISPFDNVTYRPVVVPVQMPLVPSGRTCQWPMWSDNARPSHVYCDAPVTWKMRDGEQMLSSYCPEHHARAHTRSWAA